MIDDLGTSDTGSSDSYIERSSGGGSLTAALFGLVLTAATVFGLFWNEGRAVTTARSLAEGAGLVAKVDPARVDPANDGKLIHAAGTIETGAALQDAEFRISEQVVRLVRVVEMYQWKEERNKDRDTTTYSYKRTWAEGRIRSEDFKRSEGHRNPEPIYKRRAIEAQDARLGEYRPGPAVLRKLPASEALGIPESAAAAIKARHGRDAQVLDGTLYIGVDPSEPRVGDLRISMRMARPGPASIIGAQAERDFAPYQTNAGDKLLMVSPGIVSAEQMFAQARAFNNNLTWVLRALGVVLMWLGCFLVMRPMVALFEGVPLIGSVVAAGAGLVALMVTLVVAPLTIAVAWFYYRPLLSILIVAGSAALVYVTRSKFATTAPSPAPAPTVQRSQSSFLSSRLPLPPARRV